MISTPPQSLPPGARATSALGFAAAAMVGALLALRIVSPGNQALFQVNRPASEYVALLLQYRVPLRIDLGIDSMLLVVYSAFFIGLRRTIASWRRPSPIDDRFWLGAFLVTGFLDIVENVHIFAMLRSAELGVDVGQGAIVAQAVLTQVKFFCNYFGAFLLSFVVPRQSPLERLLVFWFRYVQLPVGAALLVMPESSTPPLAILRVVSFVGGLAAVAAIVRRREREVA